jgi:hypothetical protein
MTDQEKEAERIIEMYHEYADYTIDFNQEISEHYENKKQCALIHVQGIMDVIKIIDEEYFMDNSALFYTKKDKRQYHYWKGVKEIIKNK